MDGTIKKCAVLAELWNNSARLQKQFDLGEFIMQYADNPVFDLVDEMQWEDIVEFISLEDAGLIDRPVYDSVPAAQKTYYREES